MRNLIALAVLALLMLGACKSKKTSSIEPEAGASEVLARKEKSIEPEQLGFATRIPKSAEFYISFHNFGEILSSFIDIDVFELLFAEVEEAGFQNSDIDREEIIEKFNEVAVQDAFFCIGDGAGWNVNTFGELYQDLSAAQMKLVAQLLTRILNDGAKGKVDLGQDAYKDLLGDFGSDGLKMVELFSERVDNQAKGIQFPSVYMGCTPPEEKLEEWLGLWSDTAKKTCEENDHIEPSRFAKYGANFEGFRIDIIGAIKEANEKEVEKKDSGFTEVEQAWSDALVKITDGFKGLSLVVVCGEVDGRVLIYAGPDEDSLLLVNDVQESLVSNSEFSEIGGMGGEALVGLCYASDDFLKSFQAWRGYEKTYVALTEAFQSEKLPNSEKIVGHFQSLADLEKEIQTREVSPFLMMCTMDGGLQMEMIGGRQSRNLDYSSPLQLTSAAESMQEDLFMRMHWKSDRVWRELHLDYTEEMLGAVGQLIQGGYLAFFKDSEEGKKWYDQSQMMYEELLEPELTRLWSGYRESFRPSLSGEAAILVDFHGGLPRVPNVPPSYLKQGKIPRLLYVKPVKDRAKLNEAYVAADRTLINAMDYLSVLTDKELPKPDFLSAEKGDLTTWFYPFPMMTNDFVPGVSVSDSLLMLSSSKNFAENFYEVWKSESSTGNVGTGMMIDIQFKPAWDCIENWIDLHKKENAITELSEEDSVVDAEIDEEDAEQLDYDELRQSLKRIRKWESLHWKRGVEDGKMRSSLQLKRAE